jgi:hypothetical protein
MTNDLVSMDELERESAELLPSRETLHVSSHGHGTSFSSSFTQVGYGNTAQAGLLNVSALNGSADNNLDILSAVGNFI